MSTSTTTEISSNPNSSCRLLDCLNILPFHDQRVFRSLLGHIELVRLSACCHSLRSSIRHDRALWQQLYHRDFLSGVYYVKEMEFVLWCVRTDVNNPCTLDKRADLLESVDWYNTYHRRVSTENNWRYGRCRTLHIDMEHDGCKLNYSTEAAYNSLVIIQQSRSDDTPSHYYSLEYLPHSDLRSSSNIKYNSTLSTSSNVHSLDTGNDTQYTHVTGDHYIAVLPSAIESDTNYNVKILSRKHGGVFTTFDVPAQYRVKAIEGKWILLVNKPKRFYGITPNCKFDIIVFDIDNSAMCPESIDDIWDATRFYKTTNDTAIVYTARLVKDDDTGRIEWALYQFSNDNTVVQLRNGSFQLPKGSMAISLFARNSYDSYMVIELRGNPYYDVSIIHSVASNSQSHTPRNCCTISNQRIPIPLLRAGYMYTRFNSKLTKIWTDLSYNDDQVLQMPGTIFIRHIIGDLYIVDVRNHHYVYNRLLVDLNTKKIIRKLETPTKIWRLPVYAMAGMLCSPHDSRVQIIQEYGKL